MALRTATLALLLGFARNATREHWGSADLRISICFGPRSAALDDRPVRFPPGRERLFTKPLLTGSGVPTNTIGILLVARLVAEIAWVWAATIKAGFMRTSSPARAGRRSTYPSAERQSIEIDLPSM